MEVAAEVEARRQGARFGFPSARPGSDHDTEPLPGRFPLPGIGPFTLLEESAVNHWGKVAFKWVYWNALLAGTELPIDHRMVMAGKYTAAREVRP